MSLRYGKPLNLPHRPATYPMKNNERPSLSWTCEARTWCARAGRSALPPIAWRQPGFYGSITVIHEAATVGEAAAGSARHGSSASAITSLARNAPNGGIEATLGLPSGWGERHGLGDCWHRSHHGQLVAACDFDVGSSSAAECPAGRPSHGQMSL